jgi:hypothetical protein
MQLFELAPVVSEMIKPAENEHTPLHRSTKKSVKHPGRQELPANLRGGERRSSQSQWHDGLHLRFCW